MAVSKMMLIRSSCLGRAVLVHRGQGSMQTTLTRPTRGIEILSNTSLGIVNWGIGVRDTIDSFIDSGADPRNVG